MVLVLQAVMMVMGTGGHEVKAPPSLKALRLELPIGGLPDTGQRAVNGPWALNILVEVVDRERRQTAQTAIIVSVLFLLISKCNQFSGICNYYPNALN